MPGQRFVLLLFACLPLTSSLPAADVARLSPHTWDEYVPRGKEVDCIYDDYVLRNDRLVVVIADALPTRNANMTVREVGGAIIDLTRRGRQSDQLSAYYPEARRYPLKFREMGVLGAKDQAEGAIVNLVVGAEAEKGKPAVEIHYLLSDGWDYLLVQTRYTNAGDTSLEVDLIDSLRADKGFEFMKAGQADWFWFVDRFWRQAYGVTGVDRQIQPASDPAPRSGTVLRFVADGSYRTTLKPGDSFEWSRRVFPADNLFDVKAIAGGLRNEVTKRVTVQVVGATGDAVPDALLKAGREQVPYGDGYSAADGRLAFDLPPGTYELEVSAVGREAKKLSIDTSSATSYRVQLDDPGYVVAHITGEQCGPIPCKVQFAGIEPTKDPFFAPDTADHAVHNLYYSHDGRFRQALAPGRYRAIVSYGPEHDAVFTEIEITAGKDTPLKTTLVRSVQTPGWVSADFHSHSTPSGDNTSSQFGRVLNLLAEHLEFAPCTEHNRVDTYVPHLKRLGVEHLLATCTGIELTGQPLPLNHQNAFPIIHTPRVQDGGGPQTDVDVEVQIARLALWDNRSEKLVQQNHPDLGNLFFDKNGDGQPDDGFQAAFPHMDVMEIHPLDKILAPLVYEVRNQPRNNTIRNWLQLLNRGHRIPGVVNTDAHYNFHGSGFIRNYLKSPTDDSAKIQTLDIVRAAERGNVVMTTGPYLEVSLAPEGADRAALAGEDLAAPGGKAKLRVRVQCPNWFDIDRVQVFFNGRPVESLNFTRENAPERFSPGVVKFQQELPLVLEQDAHVIVAALGEKSTLGEVMGPEYGKLMPIAVSNPIYVDVDGGGFRANGDALGSPLPVKAGVKPL